MKTKTIVLLAVFLAVLFSSFEASARIRRYRRAPSRAAQTAPRKPPAKKILHVSGSVRGLSGPSRTLAIVDDNTRSQINFVITPQTKFIRDGKPVDIAAIAIGEHVTVTYQSTDWTATEVKVTPRPEKTAPKPKAKTKKSGAA